MDAPPERVSTALSHVAHLLVLATHYLSIQLPAEITLPHRDYPQPTIFSIHSSHSQVTASFPGSLPGHSSNTSPSTSRYDLKSHVPRPRPLFLKKPLAVLAKDDPSAYSLFIEGVSHLAYNIAWVCKSQGVAVGTSSSFEDICNIGRNMYQLLVVSFRPPVDTDQPSQPPTAQWSPAKSKAPPSTSDEKERSGPHLGNYSHGATHSCLNSAFGTELAKTWKLQTPTRIASGLRAQLLGEMTGAEWELLEQQAWAEDAEVYDDGVFVGGNRRTEAGLGVVAESFMSVGTPVGVTGEAGLGETDGEGRKPGTSGWTKLKPR